MVLTIIRYTPTWVWVLLAVLLLLGWQQSRPRQVARWQLVVLPLAMLALGLSSVMAGFMRVPMSLALWLVCGATSWAVAQRWLVSTQAQWDDSKARLTLPASWLPMGLILAIFGLKYGLGIYTAMHAADAAQASFICAVAGASGALSGIFLGRASGLLRKTFTSHKESARPTIAAHAATAAR